jgi:hypothetical protein
MKIKFAVISFLACTILQVEAASLGLNFVGSDTANGTLFAGMVAGIPGAHQPFWNNISSPSVFSSNTFYSSNLTDTAGQSFTVEHVGADVSASSLLLNTTDGLHDLNDRLMTGFWSGTGGYGGKINFRNIPASYLSTGYKVIVYADATSNSTQSISLDANMRGDFTSSIFYLQDTTTFNGTFLRATSTNPTAPTRGANYIQFDDLTASTFTLLMMPSSNSDSRYFNAVQVVQSIPEISSGALCFAAAIGIFSFRHLNRIWQRARSACRKTGKSAFASSQTQ